MMAATVVLLTFAVNSHVDNDQGRYRINRIGAFIIFSALQFALIYGLNKLAQYSTRKEMKIFLSDLEANTTEGMQALAVFRRRWRIWVLIFLIIGIVLFVLGLLRAAKLGS